MTKFGSDDEIDSTICPEIESSDSNDDFICYIIHSLGNAKYLENAKTRVNSVIDAQNLTPVNYFNAIKHIEKLTDEAHPAATFHMGKIYSLGIAIPQNLPIGIFWYKKTIELYEPRAYANLG